MSLKPIDDPEPPDVGKPLIEVRCCCDVHLIGWMEGDHWEPGETYTFPLGLDTLPTDATEREQTPALKLEAAAYGHYDIYKSELIPGVRMLLGIPSSTLALKSRDYPIEQMRQIRGFHEAPAAPRCDADWHQDITKSER